MNVLRVARTVRDFSRDFPFSPIATYASASVEISPRLNIPLTVVQTWEQNSFGRTHRDSLISLRETNRSFAFHLFDAIERDKYMHDHWSGHPILDVYKSSRQKIVQADIFRYCHVYEYGGFYTDIAKAPPRPLLTYLSSNPHLLLFYVGEHSLPPISLPSRESFMSFPVETILSPIYNGFFAAAPKSPFLQTLIDTICENSCFFRDAIFMFPKNAVQACTGPVIFNHVFHMFAQRFPQSLSSVVLAPIIDSSEIFLKGSNARYRQFESYALLRNQPIL